MSSLKARLAAFTSSTLACSALAAWASIQSMPKELSPKEQAHVAQLTQDAQAFLPVVQRLVEAMDNADPELAVKIEAAVKRLIEYQKTGRLYKFIIPSIELNAPRELTELSTDVLADGSYTRIVPRQLSNHDSGIIMFNAYRPSTWDVDSAMHEAGHAVGQAHTAQLEDIRWQYMQASADRNIETSADRKAKSDRRKELSRQLATQAAHDGDLAQISGDLYKPVVWALRESTLLKCLQHQIPDFEQWSFQKYFEHREQPDQLQADHLSAVQELHEFFTPSDLARMLAQDYLYSAEGAALSSYGITEVELATAFQDELFYERWIEAADKRALKTFERSEANRPFETEESRRATENMRTHINRRQRR